MTDKKCPKCGSRDFTFTQEGRAYVYFRVENGRVYPDGGGGVDEVFCTTCTCCKCGHVWHPRNFKYVLDPEEFY